MPKKTDEIIIKSKLETIQNKKNKSIERLEKALNKKTIEKTYQNKEQNIKTPKIPKQQELTRKKEIIKKPRINKKKRDKKSVNLTLFIYLYNNPQKYLDYHTLKAHH